MQSVTKRTWITLAAAALGAMVLGSLARPAAAQEKSATHDLGDVRKTYDVLVPDGAGPFAIVLYLHPSGGPNFDAFKKDYWPLFRDRKLAVVMPRSVPEVASTLPVTPPRRRPSTRPRTQPAQPAEKVPPMQMWSAGEETFVMDCLADAQKKYPLDGKTVLLMGVSGGGQMALFLADKLPQQFRAVILASTNPVVVRGANFTWFYPNRDVLKTCPYFVFNHITEGSSLMYWRQVQVKLAGEGASISLLPILGPVAHYFPPPRELPAWLDEALAGKQSAPLADPQKKAVAARCAPAAAALAKLLPQAKPAKAETTAHRNGRVYKLTVPMPKQFIRSANESVLDARNNPITEIQIEHEKWPIYLRHDACSSQQPMAELLAAEEAETVSRGMLYQVYQTVSVEAGGRTWSVKIGSFTYPDQKRGWVSPLFAYAAAPIAADPKQWLGVLIWDETQRNELDEQAAEMAGLLKSALTGLAVGAPDPRAATTQPKKEPGK